MFLTKLLCLCMIKLHMTSKIIIKFLGICHITKSWPLMAWLTL